MLFRSVPTSFVDIEDDHNVVDPPVNPLTWTSDSKALILNDGWDLWKVSADASAPAVNLTVNGKKDQIRYRTIYRLDPDEKGIDLSKPRYVSTMAEWTKRQGIGLLPANGTGVKMLIGDDAAFGRLAKAKNGNVYVDRKSTRLNSSH